MSESAASPPRPAQVCPEPSCDGTCCGGAGRDRPGRAAKRSGGPFNGLRPFRSRAYRFLFVGTMLTMTGNFMQMVAQGWLIYDLTTSPTWLGIVSFARGLPMLILALVAGVVVDRFDRRTVLIVAQGLTALIAVILALLIATGLVQPWHVALTAFLSGCLFVLIIPARQALLSSTIERSQLGPAIALMSTGQNSGRIIGPALAGPADRRGRRGDVVRGPGARLRAGVVLRPDARRRSRPPRRRIGARRSAA